MYESVLRPDKPVRLHRPMEARAVDERSRTATPLELLFDLTFVVAVAQAAARLAEDVAAGHVLHGAGAFLMVFFAIWWAWMNFTWFASAYDADDVPYRIATFVQMAGVLVLAAGAGRAFESGDYGPVTLGYAIMRLGLVSLWVRAAVQHRPGRATALRYAAGITVLQALWAGRLVVGAGYGLVGVGSFVALAVLEIAVPAWAERTGGTTWHPHHIAERYGLFTIVLLGESVLAATNAVQELVQESVRGELLAVSGAGLVILACLWWLYFSDSAGEALELRRQWSFAWGYGHFGIFLGIAAVGAGLEVNVMATAHDDAVHVPGGVVAGSVLLPIALVLVLLHVLRIPEAGSLTSHGALATTLVALVGLGWLAIVLGPAAAILGAALSLVLLVAHATARA
jgi:low temperature requirement protein LtrA